MALDMASIRLNISSMDDLIRVPFSEQVGILKEYGFESDESKSMHVQYHEMIKRIGLSFLLKEDRRKGPIEEADELDWPTHSLLTCLMRAALTTQANPWIERSFMSTIEKLIRLRPEMVSGWLAELCLVSHGCLHSHNVRIRFINIHWKMLEGAILTKSWSEQENPAFQIARAIVDCMTVKWREIINSGIGNVITAGPQGDAGSSNASDIAVVLQKTRLRQPQKDWHSMENERCMLIRISRVISGTCLKTGIVLPLQQFCTFSQAIWGSGDDDDELISRLLPRIVVSARAKLPDWMRLGNQNMWDALREELGMTDKNASKKDMLEFLLTQTQWSAPFCSISKSGKSSCAIGYMILRLIRTIKYEYEDLSSGLEFDLARFHEWLTVNPERSSIMKKVGRF